MKRIIKLIIICALLTSCGHSEDAAPTEALYATDSPTASPTPIPTPTPAPTPIPTPTSTLHPDYDKHYISRVELIDNYWNYSESTIQKILDAYDLGFDDGYFAYEDEMGSREDGYDEGYDDGYDEGYDDGYEEGKEEGKEDGSQEWYDNERETDRDWSY